MAFSLKNRFKSQIGCNFFSITHDKNKISFSVAFKNKTSASNALKQHQNAYLQLYFCAHRVNLQQNVIPNNQL